MGYELHISNCLAELEFFVFNFCMGIPVQMRNFDVYKRYYLFMTRPRTIFLGRFEILMEAKG
jgi:hypothetical protein